MYEQPRGVRGRMAGRSGNPAALCRPTGFLCLAHIDRVDEDHALLGRFEHCVSMAPA